jgi:Phage integrase family
VKTDAAERSIRMVPRLDEVLLEHRAEFAYGPNDPVFATRLGTRNTPDNVRARIVAPVHVQANELLEAARLAPIAQLTPHTLRRTFASIVAELGVPPRRAMYLLGHRDPKFTMRVYQQVLNMGGGGQDQLESALSCTCEEAFVVLTGRVVRGLIEDPPGKWRETWRGDRPSKTKSPAKAGLWGERLKGFEPSTFCMASRRWGGLLAADFPATACFRAVPKRTTVAGFYCGITAVSGLKPG